MACSDCTHTNISWQHYFVPGSKIVAGCYKTSPEFIPGLELPHCSSLSSPRPAQGHLSLLWGGFWHLTAPEMIFSNRYKWSKPSLVESLWEMTERKSGDPVLNIPQPRPEQHATSSKHLPELDSRHFFFSLRDRTHQRKLSCSACSA